MDKFGGIACLVREPRVRDLDKAPLVIEKDSFAWFTTRFGPDGPYADPHEAEASGLALLAPILEAMARRSLDAKRVYLAGFSQGAIMGLAVAITRPDAIAGVLAMSGRYPWHIDPAPPSTLPRTSGLEGLPILVQHGSRNEALHLDFGRDRLSSLPVALDYREYEMGHGIGVASLADAVLWLRERLDGGGSSTRGR